MAECCAGFAAMRHNVRQQQPNGTGEGDALFEEGVAYPASSRASRRACARVA